MRIAALAILAYATVMHLGHDGSVGGYIVHTLTVAIAATNYAHIRRNW